MASYKRAVQWVADNDSAGESDALDVVAVSQLITTALVADIFGKDDMTVGADVVRARKQQMENEGLTAVQARQMENGKKVK